MRPSSILILTFLAIGVIALVRGVKDAPTRHDTMPIATVSKKGPLP